MAVPKQKPGQSKQTYGTPPDLLRAVRQRFGEVGWDLACTSENCVVPNATCVSTAARQGFLHDTGVDALKEEWNRTKDWHWLNPPFADIAPWVKKADETANEDQTFRLLMLVPASIGSGWFRKHVLGNAFVLALEPRLTFVGETTPYPKDCMLLVYAHDLSGFDVWRWR